MDNDHATRFRWDGDFDIIRYSRRSGIPTEKRLYGLPGTYACYVLDATSIKALRAWARANDVELVDDLHVTTVYSRVPLPAYEPADWGFEVRPTGFALLGPDRNTLAMTFRAVTIPNAGASGIAFEIGGDSQFTWRHEEAKRQGATWDYPEYVPHLTIAKDWSVDRALPKLPPFAIRFEKEVVRPLEEEAGKEDTVDMTDGGFTATTNFTKIDEDQRLVGGWVSIVHDGTAPVVDHQDDVIELADLRTAVHEFVKLRVGKVMHTGKQVAELVEIVIVDDVLRKALGAPAGPTGAWAVWKVNDDAVWARIKSGELAAFSIGGRGTRVPIE